MAVIQRDVWMLKGTLGQTDRLSGVLSLPLTPRAPTPMWDSFHFSEFAVMLWDEVIFNNPLSHTS